MSDFSYSNGDSDNDILRKILETLGGGGASGGGSGGTGPGGGTAYGSTFRTAPNITVATAGTAVQGLSIPTPRGVIISAPVSNTGIVYVGDSTVSKSDGGTFGQMLAQLGTTGVLSVSNLNQIWINADTSGDRVGVTIL